MPDKGMLLFGGFSVVVVAGIDLLVPAAAFAEDRIVDVAASAIMAARAV
jgi:hypothetical protein